VTCNGFALAFAFAVAAIWQFGAVCFYFHTLALAFSASHSCSRSGSPPTCPASSFRIQRGIKVRISGIYKFC